MTRDAIEVFKALPLFLFFFFILAVSGRAARLTKNERLITYLAFFLRGLSAIILTYQGFDYFTSDPVRYDRYAWEIARGDLAFRESLNVTAHSFIGAAIYYVFGHSIALWAMFNAFMGSLTVIVVLKIVRRIFGGLESRIAATIYAIFPSYVLLSAIIQREAVVILLIAISILQFLKYLDTPRPRYLFSFVALTIAGGLFRPLNAPLFLLLGFPFVIFNLSRVRALQKGGFLKPFLLLLGLVIIPASMFGGVYLSPLRDVIQEKLQEDSLVRVAEARASGGSAYLPDVAYNSLWEVVRYAPIKFFYFTFGPFLWMRRDMATFAGALDGLANLVFVLLAWGGVRQLAATGKKSAGYFLMAFGLGSLLAYGAIDSNFGTAIRHRISFTFIFLALASYRLARSRGIFRVLSDVCVLRPGISLPLAITALVTSASSIAAANDVGSKIPYKDAEVRIWAVNSLQKITRHFRPEETIKEFKQTVTLSAAKREYESFQIIITNRGRKDIEVTRVQLSDLTPEAGGTPVKSINSEVFYVGYVNRDYPDVLFPATVQDYVAEFKRVAVGENCNIWITIYVPAHMVAGKYRGTAAVVVNDTTHNIDILLEVWNFAIPQRSGVKTQLFSINFREVERRYQRNIFSEEYETLIKAIFEEYKKHRVSPGMATPAPLRLIRSSLSRNRGNVGQYFERWCAYWVEAGLDCNNIGTPERLEDIAAYYREIYEAISRNGWIDRVYISLPIDEAKKGERAEENIRWAKGLRRIMPDVPIHHTFGGLEAGLNREVFETYRDHVDIWAFVPDAYARDASIRSFVDDRVRRKQMVSWYIHRYMNVWQPLENLRFFFWEMWRHDVSMVTLWSTTFWSRPTLYKNVGGAKVPRVPEKKTWREERGFGSTKSSGVGNGTLFWPDRDRVLTSIRLETIRDGMEDYEYLIAAKERGIKVQVGGSARDIVRFRREVGGQIGRK